MDSEEEPLRVDLHGAHPEAALRKLQQALHGARVQGRPELLVICGRGWGNADQKPVLRTKLEAWLASAGARQAGVQGWTRTAKGGALLLRLA